MNCVTSKVPIDSQDVVNIHPPAIDILASIAVESLTKLQNTIKENNLLLSFSLSKSLAEFDSRQQLWSHEDQTLYSIEIIYLTRSLTSYLPYAKVPNTSYLTGTKNLNAHYS